jgi:hypothetical protein
MTGKRQSNSLVRSSFVAMVVAGAATFAFLAQEGDALAQTRFGDRGTLVLTAENLFAFSSERRAEAYPTGDLVNVTNRLGLLYSDRLDDDDVIRPSVSPHGPQLGFHYFFTPSMSLGGTIGYESRGGSSTPAPTPGLPSVTNSKVDVSTFTFMPKFGYAFMLTNSLGFWLRGGLGVYRMGRSSPVDSRVKDSFTLWLLSADALFVVSPAQHFGFYLGPQVDISFAGSHSLSTIQNGVVAEASQNFSYRDIGIGAGLLGYFDL